jgi:hypothetical protein
MAKLRNHAERCRAGGGRRRRASADGARQRVRAGGNRAHPDRNRRKTVIKLQQGAAPHIHAPWTNMTPFRLAVRSCSDRSASGGQQGRSLTSGGTYDNRCDFHRGDDRHHRGAVGAPHPRHNAPAKSTAFSIRPESVAGDALRIERRGRSATAAPAARAISGHRHAHGALLAHAVPSGSHDGVLRSHHRKNPRRSPQHEAPTIFITKPALYPRAARAPQPRRLVIGERAVRERDNAASTAGAAIARTGTPSGADTTAEAGSIGEHGPHHQRGRDGATWTPSNGA